MTRDEKVRRETDIAAYQVREGCTYRAAADYFGVPYAAARLACIARNGPLKDSRADNQLRAVGLLLSTAESFAAIGSRLGMTRQNVHALYKRCVRLGVPVAPRSASVCDVTEEPLTEEVCHADHEGV